MDQAQSSTPGRPLTYIGKNSKQKIFYVTVFVDSISKKVFVEFHNSTGAKEAIAAKHNMERDAYKSGVKIKSFRADNGIFKSEEFRLELKNNAQDITYCGVGAHHQNGIAERHIRTMVEKARTVLLNAHARWPDAIKMELWTFALRHVVTKWNNTPRPDLGFRTPEDVFNGMKRNKEPRSIFADFHPFGIPVYVLAKKLQDNKSLKKWEPRSQNWCVPGTIARTRIKRVLRIESTNRSHQCSISFSV